MLHTLYGSPPMARDAATEVEEQSVYDRSIQPSATESVRATFEMSQEKHHGDHILHFVCFSLCGGFGSIVRLVDCSSIWGKPL